MGKIFISYRRDDNPDAAARVREDLARRFGRKAVFMDVDNLLAGERFDAELASALSQCDVLVAVLGSNWMAVLGERMAAAAADPHHRDYVREEIASALKRGIIVIPVRVGRDGVLARLPLRSELPEDIRDLVAYQKHDVRYEYHGRDVADLADKIDIVRARRRAAAAASGSFSATAVAAAAVLFVATAGIAAHVTGVAPWLPKASLVDERDDEATASGSSGRPMRFTPVTGLRTTFRSVNGSL